MLKTLTAACALLLAFSAPTLAAEPFPTRQIRIIAPAAPGGGLDLTTRLVAEKMALKLGQPVIVDNRPGADSVLGTVMVKNAKPDGYTILAHSNAFELTPFMRDDTGYDPDKDFTGIGMMISYPMVMQVNADQPEKTVGDFVARAKAEPGKLTYASGGLGSPAHVAAALFLAKAGLQLTHVPYKGAGAALPDVAGGRVYMMFDGYNSSRPYITSGKTRVLGVTAQKRMEALPDVPTFNEAGTDYSYSLWLGLMAPTGTPKEAVDRLSDALKFALASPDLQQRFRSEGSDTTFMTPEQFGSLINAEVAQMSRVASDLKSSQ